MCQEVRILAAVSVTIVHDRKFVSMGSICRTEQQPMIALWLAAARLPGDAMSGRSCSRKEQKALLLLMRSYIGSKIVNVVGGLTFIQNDDQLGSGRVCT